MIDMNKAALRFLLSYVKKYWVLICAGLISVALSVGLQTIIPLFVGAAIDFISSDGTAGALRLPPFIQHFIRHGQGTSSVLMRYAVLVLIIAAALALFRTISRISMGSVARHIDFDIRNDYLAHLQKMSQKFFQQNKTGDLMARATNDLRAMRRLTGFGLMQAFSTVVMFAFALHFMLRISVPLTLVALAPLPLVVLVMYSFIGKIHRLFNFIQEQFSTLTAKAQENFSGIRVIKSYVREDWEIDSFKKENIEYINRNISLAKVDAFLDATLDFLLGLSAVAIIWYGGRLVIHGKLSLGELVALISYIAMLAWPMAAIGYLINMWQKAFTAARRVFNIMNHPADIADSDITDHSITEISGAIEFENVTFRYPDAAQPALQDLTLSVQQGQTIAIVGATGAGKSTFVHLLPRLIEPNEGRIRIGGHDIRTIPLQVLRRHIGMVQQESFLFSDTLAGNIAFGVADADDKIISDAVDVSQLKLDIDQFPDGLETIIGERGITLSGGQKQRTSISRAIIRKPALLILDDALSAVDTYTEEEILSQIRPLMRECTTIIVAHRISTIRDADVILVLDEGKIIERGTHEELVHLHGTYHKMFEKQRIEEHFKRLD